MGARSALFAEKFNRQAVKDNAEFGLGFEKVTKVRGAQGLAERILEPELTIPCGVLRWVWKGDFRGFCDQRCFEEVVAKETEMRVSNELPFYLGHCFLFTSESRKDTRG
jgi:hypothetical protein